MLSIVRSLLNKANEIRDVAAGGYRLSIQEEVQALGTVNRRYLLVVGSYFSLMFGYRFLSETGVNLAIMATVTAATALACFGFYLLYVRRTEDLWRLEFASLIVNLLMLANPVAFQTLHYEHQRMVYFLFLCVMYAISGVSLRVLIPSVLMAVIAGVGLAWVHEQANITRYFWLSMGGAATALGMSAMVRRTLFQAVRARATADRLRAEAEIMADCDVLTGLPNRRSFFREMEGALAGVKIGQAFDLALIDLDGFKPINDIYGHSVGDTLLIAVGDRLRLVCGKRAFVARMGGDEFAIILKGAADQDEVKDFGAHVCDALRETYNLGGVTANISGSVGFVRCDSAELTASQLLERADYALYFAKQNLRGAPVVFTERHEAEMRDFSLVDQTLRSSDLHSELSIVFQPQFDVVDNCTIGFEALARWDSARLGPVRPDIFIKAAERSGLITQITILLLEKALHLVKRWPEDTRVSFNLSARDLRSGISIANICKTVRESGIDPRRIEFEITETAMLTDFEQACEALIKLKAMGSRIAIDDFGSGYSSFSYIHRLPVDKIKIDRSFVIQLLKHDSAQKIIKTIIDLCRNLNLDCVIEGVETQAELAKLRQVRARYIQGYLFSKPILADDVLAYMAAETMRLGEARRAV